MFVKYIFAVVMMSILLELHFNTHLDTFQRYVLIVSHELFNMQSKLEMPS